MAFPLATFQLPNIREIEDLYGSHFHSPFVYFPF